MKVHPGKTGSISALDGKKSAVEQGGRSGPMIFAHCRTEYSSLPLLSLFLFLLPPL